MLALSTYMLVFRGIHILAGVLWVGSAFLFAAFIEPTAAKLGPGAGPFMNELVEKRKVPMWITVIATFNIVAGAFLYWAAWHEKASDFGTNGTWSSWIGSAPGRVFTLGALCAITGYLIGLIGVAGNVVKMNELGGEIAAGGGPPTPEQGAAMQKLQERLRLYSRTDLVFLIVAVLCMATAREW